MNKLSVSKHKHTQSVFHARLYLLSLFVYIVMLYSQRIVVFLVFVGLYIATFLARDSMLSAPYVIAPPSESVQHRPTKMVPGLRYHSYEDYIVWTYHLCYIVDYVVILLKQVLTWTIQN